MRFEVKCYKCNRNMEFYDKDYNFKGNFENYYDCPHCKECGAVLKVIYNRAVSISYTLNETNTISIAQKDINKYVNDTLQGSEF